MRGYGVLLGIVLAVLAGTGWGVAGEEDWPTDSKTKAKTAAKAAPSGGKWWPRNRKKAPEKKPAAKKDTEKDSKDKDKDEAPLRTTVKKTDEAAAERAREEANYFRRCEVCLKLQAIANENDDAELRRMAEHLEERAKLAYQERIAHLPSAAAAFESDEQVLKKHLGTAGGPVDRATASKLPYSVSGKESAARTKTAKENP